jgi:hypothetical protein
MYKPLFNQVLVEVDTEGDKWGTGNDDSMLGKDYREGTLVGIGPLMVTEQYPELPAMADIGYLGRQVMWNQGHEAGKTFEHDGKLYAFVYWFDLVAVKDISPDD